MISGSSPHTRGALIQLIIICQDFGIIPAYAGSTINKYNTIAFGEDHPRIRGEHLIFFQLKLLVMGSSPHTRGALRPLCRSLWLRGIIPAYAGSTPARDANGWHRWDHPRIRGEHQLSYVGSNGEVGSSPHTRGALEVHAQVKSEAGIIPAYAGSTSFHPWCIANAWDHPRIRGEHCVHTSTPSSAMGSSPHTRGARIVRELEAIYGGIIPAYAGSTHRP